MRCGCATRLVVLDSRIFRLWRNNASLCKLKTEHASDVLQGMDDEEDSWDLESMVTAKEVATSDTRTEVQDVQRVCEDGGEAVPTTIVEATVLARECVEARRKNATLSGQITNTEAKLVTARTAKSTMREQLAEANCRITVLKAHLYKT